MGWDWSGAHAVRRVVVAAASIAAVAAAGGCGGGQQAAAVRHLRLPHDRWSHARAVFREKCSGCHALADAGAHGRRSDLDRSGLAFTPHPVAVVRTAMEHGAPGMPVWEEMMPPEDFDGLVHYVATVAGTRVAPRPPAPHVRAPRRRDRYTYARTLFDEICATCHMLADAGAHIGRFDMDHSPLSESTQRSALARFVMTMGYHAGMPAFKGVLTDREFDALAAYITKVAGAPLRNGG
jgi:mono/diheme cytochrome c family protein